MIHPDPEERPTVDEIILKLDLKDITESISAKNLNRLTLEKSKKIKDFRLKFEKILLDARKKEEEKDETKVRLRKKSRKLSQLQRRRLSRKPRRQKSKLL